jgi:hypothetical protein
VGDRTYWVGYHPAESESSSFGGNSNWRGPMWMPINLLIVRALLNLHRYYGENFKVECPTGSGRLLTLLEVSEEIARRTFAIFQRGPDGRRPLYGGTNTFQTDPHWRDLILFYEYFHGDNGAGLGASHQTGWTGGVSLLTMLTRSAASMRRVVDGDRDQFFAALAGMHRGRSWSDDLAEGAHPPRLWLQGSALCPHYDHRQSSAREWLMLLSQVPATSGAWRIRTSQLIPTLVDSDSFDPTVMAGRGRVPSREWLKFGVV